MTDYPDSIDFSSLVKKIDDDVPDLEQDIDDLKVKAESMFPVVDQPARTQTSKRFKVERVPTQRLTKTGKVVDESDKSELYSGDNPCPSKATLSRKFKNVQQYTDENGWQYWDGTDHEFNLEWVKRQIESTGQSSTAKLLWARPPSVESDKPIWSVTLQDKTDKSKQYATSAVIQRGDMSGRPGRKTTFIVVDRLELLD